ncbi:MAG: hypothetical protein M3483_08595 [Gemmatimonadota bacterium]|jgi:hypothetical protein|nr:hypothetical protein [Gemmatimonadota bacterium]
MSTEVTTMQKTAKRRRPNPERIRSYLANAENKLWKKPVEELSPEEIARLKRRFFSDR